MSIKRKASLAAAVLLSMSFHFVHASEDLAVLLETHFPQSTLSQQQQLEELNWFAQAAQPLKGMSIKVMSENIATHYYESEVLAPLFTAITGIEVQHDVVRESEVIHQLWLQLISGINEYDAFVNDSDSIGYHFRSGRVLNLTEFMAGIGEDFTSPGLDLDDFIGLDFVRAPDGDLYQLPDQQFANLYWFRYDWFQRSELQQQFRELYGYELGVPVNWSAYEDIAEFFTVYVQQLDGQRVYGHSDYGKRDPSLGWRFTDAWLSMAGAGDPGLPNGLPVDDWGIRMEGCSPVGSDISRGGATNSPAAVYALTTFIDWLDRFAPPESKAMTFEEAGALPAQGNIAQQIFWYTVFTPDMLEEGLPVTHPDGTPRWRMAPSPYGAYWQEGMKLGYQDVGAWTIPAFMSERRQQAAWLYAQFTTSKTVSLQKTLAGLTPIRASDIESEVMTELAPRLGGLVEFYRSQARNSWTPTGINVPDYPRLSTLWWPNIADAIEGLKTPQEALDQLAREQDRAMRVMQRTFQTDLCPPRIAMGDDIRGADYWLSQPGAPKPRMSQEKPPGQTLPYEALMRQWQ